MGTRETAWEHSMDHIICTYDRTRLWQEWRAIYAIT